MRVLALEVRVVPGLKGPEEMKASLIMIADYET